MWFGLVGLVGWIGCADDACKEPYCGATYVGPAVDAPLLVCSELGFETADQPLEAFCVGCDGLECRWQTLANPSEVARVELDVMGAAPDRDDWSEFHDAFTHDADGLWELTLHRVASTGEYVSGETSVLQPESSDVSWLFSAADAEGVYVDCAYGGPEVDDWSDCRRLTSP